MLFNNFICPKSSKNQPNSQIGEQQYVCSNSMPKGKNKSIYIYNDDSESYELVVKLDKFYVEMPCWEFLNSNCWGTKNLPHIPWDGTYQVLHYENYLIIATIDKQNDYPDKTMKYFRISIQKYNIKTRNIECHTLLVNLYEIVPIWTDNSNYATVYACHGQFASWIFDIKTFKLVYDKYLIMFIRKNNKEKHYLTSNYKLPIFSNLPLNECIGFDKTYKMKIARDPTCLFTISCCYESLQYIGKVGNSFQDIALSQGFSNDILFQILDDCIQGKKIPGYSVELQSNGRDKKFLIFKLICNRYYVLQTYPVILYLASGVSDIYYEIGRNCAKMGHPI